MYSCNKLITRMLQLLTSYRIAARIWCLLAYTVNQNYSTELSNLVMQSFQDLIWAVDQCRPHGLQNRLFKVRLPD